MTIREKYAIIVSYDTVCEGDMRKSEILDKLRQVSVFSVLSESELQQILCSSEIKSYSSGQDIVDDRSIKVILSGKAAIKKSSGGKLIIMRMMDEGGVCGVASLFSEEQGISFLTAVKKLEIMLIKKDVISDLIRTNGAFAERYILFLTSRIRFLNMRIKAYTAGSAEARFAFHLLMLDECESGSVEMGISYIKLAEMLDIGRASLYRAIESLCEKDIIKREGKKIIIKDKSALSDIANGIEKNKNN